MKLDPRKNEDAETRLQLFKLRKSSRSKWPEAFAMTRPLLWMGLPAIVGIWILLGLIY